MDTILELFRGPVADQVATVMFHFVWQALAIAIATALASATLRSARGRYAIGCIGLVTIALAPIATAMVTSQSAPSAPVTLVTATTSAAPASPVAATPLAASSSTLDTLPATDWQSLLLLFWCVGCSLLGLRNTLGLLRVQHLRRAGTEPPTPAWLARFDRLRRELRVGARCDLLWSRAVDTPSVVGHFKPIVLVPLAALTQLAPEQIEALLAHELAHVRRRDYLMNLLQVLVETLFFFHPAVWWLSRRVRIEREYCCDDVAVGASPRPHDYASALAAMEETRHAPRLALAAGRAALLPRIQRILGREPRATRRPTLAGALTAVVAATTLLCCAGTPPSENYPDRAGFAKKLATLEVGAPKSAVIALLGRPDSVIRRSDKRIFTSHTKEVLCWGTARNVKRFVVGGRVELRETGRRVGLATLGKVYIDGQDKVQYVFGAAPCKPITMPERELRELLEFIDEVPSLSFGDYSPPVVIDVVNRLHALGKDKALAVIEEYLRVASGFHSPAREGLFGILAILFEVPATGHHPRMGLGAASPEEPAGHVFPRWPIALAGDVPYLLINGYRLAGLPEPVANKVAHFREHGVLRKTPLHPRHDRRSFDRLVAKVRLHMDQADQVIRHLEAQQLAQTGRKITAKVQSKGPRIILPPAPHDQKTRDVIARLKQGARFAFRFNQAPLAQVADTISKLTGTNFIASKTVRNRKIDFDSRTATVWGALQIFTHKNGLYAIVEKSGAIRLLDEKEYRFFVKASLVTPNKPVPGYRASIEVRFLAIGDLTKEKQRLHEWLDKDGNDVSVAQNPMRLASYHGLTKERGGRLSKDIRWYPRVIGANSRGGFDYSMAMADPESNAIALFDKKRLDAGPKKQTDTLIELIPVDMKTRGFSGSDFLPEGFQKSTNPQTGGKVLLYQMKPVPAKAYARLTEANINRNMPVLIDGYVVSAPRIMSRIPGRGMIMMPEKRIDAILESLKK